MHIQDLFSQYFEEELVTANCNMYEQIRALLILLNSIILQQRCNMDVTKSKASQVNAPKMLCIHIFKDPSKYVFITHLLYYIKDMHAYSGLTNLLQFKSRYSNIIYNYHLKNNIINIIEILAENSRDKGWNLQAYRAYRAHSTFF